MNAQAQNIAIAEACDFSVVLKETGWKSLRSPDGQFSREYGNGTPDADIWKNEKSLVPDYLNDLNAMHGAEKTLTAGHLWEYRLVMQEVKGLGGNNHWKSFRASAAQRAEAFLRTIGKWKEYPKKS